jgi:NDP-sugar pyrophosphorylase family protein
MAAGIGSRYGGIKQIDPVGPGGEILLDYAVYDAVRAGFSQVVFILREEIEDAFRERIEPTIARHVRVRYVLQRLDAVPAGVRVPLERRKPWGTAHAVLACGDVLDGPFGVINADDFYGRGAFELLHDFLLSLAPRGNDLRMALVGYPLENTLTEHGHVSRGVCRVAADGTLEEIHERKRIQRFDGAVRYADAEGRWHEVSPGATVSMNMWGFPREVLEELDARQTRFFRDRAADLETAEFLLPEVVGDLVREKRGSVRVLPTSERWFGVTYPEDKLHVERAIRRLIDEGVYPPGLWRNAPRAAGEREHQK